MNWRKLFTPIANLSPAEARDYMDSHPADDFQLLDVRQPREYEEGHLPGARLIPIRELPDRLDELNPDQPVIAYCAVGGRSRAAAQLLSGQGFKEVYNLAGGIKAWEGERATGPFAAGLELLPAGAEYEQAAALAYAMEEGLRQFYLHLAGQAGESGFRSTWERLAALEEGHKARLLQEYCERTGHEVPPGREGELLEGGRRPDDTALAALLAAATPPELLAEAMGLETQALDLYLRLARHSEVAASRELFLALAAEEKQHLSLLAAELERH
ncbi:MAG TPA: sulfurtransferase [Desulfurivibrio alkaliphilus]|uniref:Sulfurtransferase n=1 Tax=Desulfurivibrio alkaliphilus TaxID=427923 RepID=A0A7C2XN54_9BACT|nr:sulfurtransferase [Desulfurivibrio alkaliphilus]